MSQSSIRPGSLPYGAPSAVPPGGPWPPGSLVRRPNTLTYLKGGVMVLVGALFLMFDSLMLVSGVFDEPVDPLMVVLGAVGLLSIGIGLALMVRRTVFDSDGIHSRWLGRTSHLPWPDSRSAFSTSTSHRNATVKVIVEDRGTVRTLAAPYVTAAGGDSVSGLCSRLAAEVDRIWAWAVAQGYTRETGPLCLYQGAVPAYGGAALGIHAPGATGPGAVGPGDEMVRQDPLVLREGLGGGAAQQADDRRLRGLPAPGGRCEAAPPPPGGAAAGGLTACSGS